jgi:aflatoxin B1 aldehyde reductase
MTQEPKTKIKVVLGAMTIGKEGAEQARIHDYDKAGELLDTFTKYGHRELDTARVYGGGSSEEYLGKSY